jgi:ABC-type glycerol-3-phosphate transport system permease component
MVNSAVIRRWSPGRHHIGRVSRSLCRQGVLLVFTSLSLLPIYFMIVSSLKTNAEFSINQFGLPRHPVLSTLAHALAGGDLYRWLCNSFLITAASVALSTVLAALAAYPLSLMRWRFGPVILGTMIGLMVVPPIVLIIPIFQMVVDIRQLNTYHAVIVIYSGIMLPFSTFLLASFFSTISPTLLDAARIDGAGTWRIFWEIVLPLSGAALMTVVTVQALWVWNEVLIAIIFLQDQRMRTLMVGLALFNSKYRIEIPIAMGGMLWATVPMLAVYLMGQRFFVRGLTAGGVKG